MRSVANFCMIFILFAVMALGQIPKTISYQGYLTEANGNAVADGDYALTFNLYDVASGGSPLWGETQSLAATSGVFNAVLGSKNSIDLSFDVPYWLGIIIGDGAELAPRIQLTASPYSFIAGSVTDTTISSAMVKDNTIIGIKIAGKQVVRSINSLTDSVRIVGGENIVITATADSLIVSSTATSGGNGYSLNAADGDPTDVVYVDNEGRVGIGKTDPDEILDVVGNIHSSGKVSSGNSITINGAVTGDDSPDRITASSGSLSILGNPDTTDIKVGIGKNPSNKLDVAGTVFASVNGGKGVYAVHGLNSSSGNFGKLGDAGFGVLGINGNGNEGYLGGVSWAVYGQNTTGTKGYIGSSNYGVYGEGGGNNSYAGYFVGQGYFSEQLRAVGLMSDGADIIAGNGGGLLISGGGKIDLMDKNGNGPIISLEPTGKTSGMITTPILKITGGGDIAEPFKITGKQIVEPGMVVAIDSQNPGQLCLANKAYDRTVAGVVSGAKGINPGMTMSQRGTIADGAYPVALTGRVYVWADAENAPIAPGNLLTTSDTPGHAMKVTDYDRAQGAIIGKAMTSLANGTGLVLVLVSLQ